MTMDHECLSSIWYQHNSKLFFRPIIPFVCHYFDAVKKCNGKLLDLGCGSGEKANALSKIGFEVTGIDCNAGRIATAKKNYPLVDFRSYYIDDQLPFGDNYFDVIFSNSVFQYIEHDSIIRECKRILKPDGCIILIENYPVTKPGRAFRKATGHIYRTYPYNHFTYKEFNAPGNEFNDAVLAYFHFLAPLSQLKLFKPFFGVLHKADKLLLQFPVIQRYACMFMFAAMNK